MVSLSAIMAENLYIFQQDTTLADSTLKEAGGNAGTFLPKNMTSNFEDNSFLDPFGTSEFVATQKQADPQLVLPAYERASVNTDWLAALIFVATVIFATVRYSYVNYIKHLFTSLVNYPTAVRLLQERNYPVSHAAFRLDVIFYIGFSIFIFQILNIMEIGGSSNRFLFFMMVAAGILIYFIGKRFLYHLTGTLFETRQETGEFLFNMSNFNRSLGMILIPLVALISFSPVKDPKIIVFTGITIVLAFNLVLLHRGILILLKKQFSILYLFLYLCTLEFLPLLLIYKVVVVE